MERLGAHYVAPSRPRRYDPEEHLGRRFNKYHDSQGKFASHAGGVSVPYDAIMPGTKAPTEAEASAAARAVTKTSDGKRLRRITVAFQSKSGEVEQIQRDFMTRAARKSTGDGRRDADIDVLTAAIRHAPATDHDLYRGFSLDKDVDVNEWLGKSQILPPTSFSSDRRLANSFKGPTLKQGRRQVQVTLKPTNRRALPIEKYGTPKYAYEREWLTAGQFTVTKVEQSRGHWQIEMEHTGVFQEASE